MTIDTGFGNPSLPIVDLEKNHRAVAAFELPGITQ
jgi:hypothetical protein